MKNLAKAVIAVMTEIKGMEKNSTVGSGNYAYSGVKDQDVKEAFNHALSKNGLCILPISIEDDTKVDRWEETYNGNVKQKQSILTVVRTKYLLLHESGESIELAGYGHGVDNNDKGAGKATTYALKQCLLYTFLTPVGKIDDTDTTHSNDIETPKAKPQPVVWLTDAQLEKAINSDQKGIEKTLRFYGTATHQMKEAQRARLDDQLSLLVFNEVSK